MTTITTANVIKCAKHLPAWLVEHGTIVVTKADLPVFAVVGLERLKLLAAHAGDVELTEWLAKVGKAQMEVPG